MAENTKVTSCQFGKIATSECATVCAREKARADGATAPSMTATGGMVCAKAKAPREKVMAAPMSDSGRTIKCMAVESKHAQTAPLLKDVGCKDSSKAM